MCKSHFFFREIIRRKAVQALYKFYLIAPNQVQHIHDKFRKALCDRDVGVMAASLHIYLEMIKVGKELKAHLNPRSYSYVSLFEAHYTVQKIFSKVLLQK